MPKVKKVLVENMLHLTKSTVQPGFLTQLRNLIDSKSRYILDSLFVTERAGLWPYFGRNHIGNNRPHNGDGLRTH